MQQVYAHTHTHTKALTDGSIQTDGGQTDRQTEGDCKATLRSVAFLRRSLKVLTTNQEAQNHNRTFELIF